MKPNTPTQLKVWIKNYQKKRIYLQILLCKIIC